MASAAIAKNIVYRDYSITINSNTGRVATVSIGITGYTPISVSFIYSNDLYHLLATDGMYINLSLSTSQAQIVGINKSFATAQNRTIMIRVAYLKE